jgi:hypothetical protein
MWYNLNNIKKLDSCVSECLIIVIFEKFLIVIMYKIFAIVLTALVIITSQTATAQSSNDTILMMSGQEVISMVYDTSFGNITYKNPKPDGDPITVETSDVFSIRNNKGEMIKYVQDTAGENDLTVEEMRYYIKGQQDARKGFKPRGAFWANIGIGLASGATGSFFCPIPPFAFTALSGLTKVKIKHSTVSNLEYLKHDTYILGYEHIARGKRKTRSLIGGGIGLVGGLGAAIILKNTGNSLIKN